MPDQGRAAGLGTCTMCDERPATTTYGAPVCQPCHAGLVGLDVDLKRMEADDPHLAELGRRVDDAARRYFDDPE